MSRKKLTSKVIKEIDSRVEYIRNYFEMQMERCESPIEQLLYIHLIDVKDELQKDLSYMNKDNVALLNPQEVVMAGDSTYRLDFQLKCIVDGLEYKFAIECDGHDFHEKTKEQAKRDKERDRKLIVSGYTPIRFTGSEIWKSPVKCAYEVNKIIRKAAGIDKFWDDLVREDLYGDE